MGRRAETKIIRGRIKKITKEKEVITKEVIRKIIERIKV